MEVDSCQYPGDQTSSWIHVPDDLCDSISVSEVWFIQAMWRAPVELTASFTPSFFPVDSATSSVVHVDPSWVDSQRSVVLYIAA